MAREDDGKGIPSYRLPTWDVAKGAIWLGAIGVLAYQANALVLAINHQADAIERNTLSLAKLELRVDALPPPVLNFRLNALEVGLRDHVMEQD